MNKKNSNQRSYARTKEQISNTEPIWLLSFVILLVGIISPELAIAGELTVEQSLEKAKTLANGDLKNIFLSITTVGGLAGAIYKGSIQMALMVVCVVVIAGMLFAWISGGMKFGA